MSKVLLQQSVIMWGVFKLANERAQRSALVNIVINMEFEKGRRIIEC